MAARLWKLAALVAIASLGYANDARADARTQARKSFEDGLKKVERGDYTAAIEAFELANRILPHPDVQYNLAFACVDAGRYEEAIKWFEIYLDQPTSPQDRREIEALLSRLRKIVEAKPAVEPEPRIEPGPAGEDASKLEEMARLIRPLAPDRARELDEIAIRLRTRPAMTSTSALPSAESTEAQPVTIDSGAIITKTREVEEYQEQELVSAATREETRRESAPGVVWVITQQEIRERGYETVAEALKSVAGLHVVDDQVFVDVGVRGVHAGLRGQSRIIKVLIDGHPVSFRPTSGNLLGLEMIPIRAIDRIELVRGPASALYGANAFLGVVQVVTRRGGDIRGGSITGRFGLSAGREATGGTARPSGSGDVILGTESEGLSLLFAAQSAGLDRSGMRLPETSPLGAALSASGGEISENDTSTPISIFASITYRVPRAGEIKLEGGLQRLHSRAEWLDYGALTHYSRVALHNLWARLGYEENLTKSLALSAFVSYEEGAPDDANRLRVLRTGATDVDGSKHLVESYGSRAFFSGLELKWDSDERWGLRIGADLDLDRQELQSARTVFDEPVGARMRGDSIPAPGAQQGDQSFENLGVYLQLSLRPRPWIDAIAGVRLDYHNLYQSSVNGRVGSVFRLSKVLHLKALYGSSFRAPAADQLFHGAAYLGDTIGCRNYAPCASVGLKPQRAHTGELVLGGGSGPFDAQLTGYVSFVDELIISFPNVGGFFVTTNAGSYLSRGLELDASAKLVDLQPIAVKAHVFFSLSRTDADIPASQFDPPESIREEFQSTALFPDLSGGAGIDLAHAPSKLGLYLEARYIGPRRPSGSNLALGAYEDGELGGYVEMDAHLSTRDLVLVGDRETILSLRATNLFDARSTEGGFRGWDVPGRGRVIFFRAIQEF
jgi:outer membrane receptor protein involved in Fe transport